MLMYDKLTGSDRSEKSEQLEAVSRHSGAFSPEPVSQMKTSQRQDTRYLH